MAAAVSGRSSVEQDEDLVRRMHSIPQTPVKMSSSKMGFSSASRRRGLFIPASPASSEASGGLGHMSPLSSSLESLPQSPSFSPNGECFYDTPKKTLTRNITVRSSLFPALQKHHSRGSPSIQKSIAVLQDILGDSESNSCLSTPRQSRCIVAETSPSSVGTAPSQKKTTESVAEIDFYDKPKPVTPEDFYAPRPMLVIDTLINRSRKTSVEAKPYGVHKRRRSSSRSTSRSSKRLKGGIPGVWHGIKKPKKMNKNAPKPKPVVSPYNRIEIESEKRVRKGKRLFQENPRQRLSNASKRVEEIFDTFPPPLIKRKKLPSSPLKEPEPDQSKKFLKFGSYRRATFKLNNMQLEFSKGHVRVKTPEKRRRLRVAKPPKVVLDAVDFSIQEPETEQIQKDVDNILKQLIDDDEVVEKISPTGLAENHSSPQGSLLANMSSLKLNDLSATAGILAQTSNILNGAESDQENCGYYPVFDPKTWKSAPLTDLTNTPKKSKKKVLFGDDQYLLDAGQKSIGVISCKECGVMYQAGDYLDEMAHNNVHNHLSELAFHGWKDERVVSTFQDGRIVMITANDPKTWQMKAKKVVGVVDLELGFSENSLKWTPDKKVLLFVCEKLKQVVGCLVMETCTEGYRMYPSVDGIEVDTCARDPTPCKFGISRIWTAVHRRRRSVASRMFQTLCRICGSLKPDDFAFSIPSPDGKMLARSVIGRDDFKVYGFISS